MSAIPVLERTEKAKKVRKEGNIPAIIYGSSLEKAIPIKIEKSDLNTLLRGNSKSSILLLKLQDKIKPCVVKDIHKDNITGEVIHVDFQAIKRNENIKVKVPIIFTNREVLEHKKMILESFINEIEMYGNINNIPETIEIDLSNKNAFDKIFVKDIILSEEFKIISQPENIIAVLNPLK